MYLSIVSIRNVVEDLLNWVRDDITANELTPELSWLYLTFHELSLEGLNFYDVLLKLLTYGDENQRKLEIRMMFDRDRANLPTIHINYPTEEGRSGDNSINTGGSEESGVGLYSRSFTGQYELIITGGNSIEVVMLYEFVDALLIAGADTLAYHFDRFEISGRQLMVNQDMIPYLTFYRAVGLTLQSKKYVRSITKINRAISIEFNGKYY